MYYYTYVQMRNNGQFYIGRHTGNVKPELDTSYVGSGTEFLKIYNQDPNSFKKRIMSTHTGAPTSAEENMKKEETRLIGELWKTDSNCLNEMAGESGTFYGVYNNLNNPNHGTCRLCNDSFNGGYFNHRFNVCVGGNFEGML